MRKFSTKTLVRGHLSFDEQHQYGGLAILNKFLLTKDIYYSALPDSLGDIPGKEAFMEPSGRRGRSLKKG